MTVEKSPMVDLAGNVFYAGRVMAKKSSYMQQGGALLSGVVLAVILIVGLLFLTGDRGSDSPVQVAAGGEDTAAMREAFRTYGRPFQAERDIAVLAREAGERRFVLMGESTHGTADFYTLRAALSQALIEEYGFRFIAVEGDWASIGRLNDYIQGREGAADSARAALESFYRWPRWMWANEEFAAFGEWLRAYNEARDPADHVHIYGMDLYGHEEAAGLLNRFLSTLRLDQPPADPQMSLTDFMAELVGDTPDEEGFYALQAAHVISAAEAFYGNMGRDGSITWNIRATHMADTLHRLAAYHSRLDGTPAKGIIWAHNTHIGDARATDMGARGEVNIGQLSRERFGARAAYLVGFTKYGGTVLAGRAWEAPRELMRVAAPPAGSFESMLAAMDKGDAFFTFPPVEDAPALLRNHSVGHRAIGVVYNPERDYMQYVPSFPALRYDALVYIEKTSALTPIHEQEAQYE